MPRSLNVNAATKQDMMSSMQIEFKIVDDHLECFCQHDTNRFQILQYPQ